MVVLGIAISAVTGLVLAGTGWWRLAFRAAAIRPNQMTVRKLGLLVNSPDDAERVDAILGHFAGGFNVMLTARNDAGWRDHGRSIEPLYQPFAEEGIAMGYTLRRLFRYDAREFEAAIVKPRPEFRYLHYVGLGFWSGMRNHSAARIAKIVEGLDPLHGYLCYDGYGFKHAFFEYRKNPDVLRRLDALEGYAVSAAYQGVGRAFYFLFMSDPETLVEHIRRTGDNAVDVAAGLGLAATFVNPDRLDKARLLGKALPAAWQPHFHLGMCFALKARSISDRGFLERCVGREDSGAREAVWASIRECDRIELLIRSRLGELGAGGYPQWRRQVTDWLGEHIEYPMGGVRTPVGTGGWCENPFSRPHSPERQCDLAKGRKL